MSVTWALVSRAPRCKTMVKTGWSSPAAGTLNHLTVSLRTTALKNGRSASAYASNRSKEAAATSKSSSSPASEPSLSITTGS